MQYPISYEVSSKKKTFTRSSLPLRPSRCSASAPGSSLPHPPILFLFLKKKFSKKKWEKQHQQLDGTLATQDALPAAGTPHSDHRHGDGWDPPDGDVPLQRLDTKILLSFSGFLFSDFYFFFLFGLSSLFRVLSPYERFLRKTVKGNLSILRGCRYCFSWGVDETEKSIRLASSLF